MVIGNQAVPLPECFRCKPSFYLSSYLNLYITYHYKIIIIIIIISLFQFSKEVKIPRGADLDRVQSTIDDSGTLWIEVPVQDMHVSYDATESDATITRENSGHYIEQDRTLTRDHGSSRHYGGGAGKETVYSSSRTYTSGGGGGVGGGGSRTMEYSSRSGSRGADFSVSGGGRSSSRGAGFSASSGGRSSSRAMEYSSGGGLGGGRSRTVEYSTSGGGGGGGRTVEYSSRRTESRGPIGSSHTTERVSSRKSGTTVINV